MDLNLNNKNKNIEIKYMQKKQLLKVKNSPLELEK